MVMKRHVLKILYSFDPPRNNWRSNAHGYEHPFTIIIWSGPVTALDAITNILLIFANTVHSADRLQLVNQQPPSVGIFNPGITAEIGSVFPWAAMIHPFPLFDRCERFLPTHHEPAPPVNFKLSARGRSIVGMPVFMIPPRRSDRPVPKLQFFLVPFLQGGTTFVPVRSLTDAMLQQ